MYIILYIHIDISVYICSSLNFVLWLPDSVALLVKRRRVNCKYVIPVPESINLRVFLLIHTFYIVLMGLKAGQININYEHITSECHKFKSLLLTFLCSTLASKLNFMAPYTLYYIYMNLYIYMCVGNAARFI